MQIGFIIYKKSDATDKNFLNSDKKYFEKLLLLTWKTDVFSFDCIYYKIYTLYLPFSEFDWLFPGFSKSETYTKIISSNV